MKVLSIGNSFSEDSHKWLTKLAQTQNEDIQADNLFIGGCLLELHLKLKFVIRPVGINKIT